MNDKKAKLQAIQYLIDSIRKDNLPRWIDITNAIGLSTDDRHLLVANAYSGSFSSAIRLIEILIPGWKWQVGFELGNWINIRSTVWLEHEDDSKWVSVSAVHTDKCRAVLLAALRAYKSTIE